MWAQVGFAALALLLALPAVHGQDDQKPVVTFLSHRSGGNVIYTMNPEGADIKPVFGGPVEGVPSFTEGMTLVRQPHWTRQSPNGKFFASWVYEFGIPYEKYQGELRPMLWIGDLQGRWTRIVNPDCEEEFAWSPDSKRIAYDVLSSVRNRGFIQKECIESTLIYTAGIDGAFADCVLEREGVWSVQDWSSGGQRLLLIRKSRAKRLEEWTSELFEFHLADALAARERAGEGTSLHGSEWTAKSAGDYLKKVRSDLPGFVVSEARYGPDGKSLAMVVYDPRKMYAPNLVNDVAPENMARLLGKIAISHVDTGEARIIADYADGIRGPICWSPDGAQIFFSRYLPKGDDREKFAESKEHGLSIWSIDRDGKDAKFITTGWSPDCRRNALK